MSDYDHRSIVLYLHEKYFWKLNFGGVQILPLLENVLRRIFVFKRRGSL